MAGKLVTIATFGHSSDAHLARSALEAAGIPVTLNNEETTSLFGPATTALGSIRLVVREEDEERAVKVLDDTFGSEPMNEADLAAQAEAAPAEDPVDAGQQVAVSIVDPAADSAARERDARFALFAVCFGFLIPFGHLFAFVMIVQACSGPGELSRRGRYHVYAAVLIFAVLYLPLLILVLSLASS